MERRFELPVLSLKQLVKRTCKTAAKNYGTFFISHLIATGIVFVIIALMISLAVPQLMRAISMDDIDFGFNFILLICGSSVLLTIVNLFLTVQFSTGLVFAVVKDFENGNKMSLGGAYTLAKNSYKNVTLTLLAVLLCSLGIGAAAMPLGIVALIPIIGILAIIGVSYMLEIIYIFSVCAAAADNKTAFSAIKLGATVTFYGGFFKTLLHMFFATVVMGAVIAALSLIAVPALLNGKVLDIAILESLFYSRAWYMTLAAFWIITSAVSPFLNVFIYYLYANARICTANKAYEKIAKVQNIQESWEAYKEDEAKKKWEELSHGCHVFEEEADKKAARIT